MAIIGNAVIIPRGGASRLPAEYQEVEYIQTDGTAYIDTGAIPDGYGKVYCDFYIPSTAVDDLWGVAESSGTKRFMMSRYPASGNVVAFYATKSSTYQSITIPFPSASDMQEQWLSFDCRSGGNSSLTMGLAESNFVVGNGSNVTLTSYAFTAAIPIFAQHYNGSIRKASSGTRCRKWIYYAGEAFTLSRNYVSCYRKSSGVIGMYDLAQSGAGNDPTDNNFFVNAASSGSFTKGADVF